MAKQITLLILLLSLCVGDVLSQSKATPGNETNLYAIALAACAGKEAKNFEGIKLEQPRDFYNRVVEKDTFLTDKLPTQLGEFKFEYLDADALRDRYTKTREEIEILSLRPMRNEGNILKITVGIYWFSYTKRKYRYGLAGACNIDFKYDVEKEKFVLAKIDLWGV